MTQEVTHDTLLMELRNLLAWPYHKIMVRARKPHTSSCSNYACKQLATGTSSKGRRRFAAPKGGSASPASLQAQAAASLIRVAIEEEFDVLQFLEGCKAAFVAGACQPGWSRTCFHAVKRLLWLLIQACCSALMLLGPCSLSELTVRPLHSQCFLPALQCMRACSAQETLPQWCRFQCSKPLRKCNTLCSWSPGQHKREPHVLAACSADMHRPVPAGVLLQNTGIRSFLLFLIRPGSVNPGQPKIVGCSLMPRRSL